MMETVSAATNPLPPPQSTLTHHADAAEEEEEDAFDDQANEARPVFDLTVLQANNDTSTSSNSGSNSNSNSNGGNQQTRRRGNALRRPPRDDASVATTAELASSVGSVVMMPKEAFLKSFTIFKSEEEDGGDNTDHVKNKNWNLLFGSPQKSGKKGGYGLRTKTRLPVEYVDDDSLFALSRISPGDYLKTINGKTVGPSVTGPMAIKKMKTAFSKDGYLTITTKNKEEGFDDILVHATLIQPRPNMTAAELGIKVWFWGYLCIKELDKKGLFGKTALKETDQIVSVNEIVCDTLKPEEFEALVKKLPREITITVLRRKERVTGKFG